MENNNDYKVKLQSMLANARADLYTELVGFTSVDGIIDHIKQIKFALAELEEEKAKPKPKAVKKKAKTTCEYSNDFEFFWNTFSTSLGGKGSKPKAFAEFKKLDMTQKFFSFLIETVEQQVWEKKECKKVNQWTPQFKDVERWLRDKRWEDDPILIDTHECAAMTNLTDTSWANGAVESTTITKADAIYGGRSISNNPIYNAKTHRGD